MIPRKENLAGAGDVERSAGLSQAAASAGENGTLARCVSGREVLQRRMEMKGTLLALFAASALAASAADAQTHQGPGHGSQQDRPGMMQQQSGGGQSAENRTAGMMMGHGGGMMAGGMRHARGGAGHMGPGMLTMMMVMMDTNADRALSLEEFQAVHARMFKYADADNDGKLTIEELRNFHSGEADPDQD